MGSQDDRAIRRAELLALLERLHRHKDAAYGDAWRKRGEVIAIFANIARKYDRLLVAFEESRSAATEPLSDTVADLCVYAVKYLTWLAETEPHAIRSLPRDIDADEAAADRGPQAVATVLAALGDASTLSAASGQVDQTWASVQYTFGQLERGLMAQATPGSPPDDLLDWSTKAMLAWELADQSAWLLTALVERDADVVIGLRSEVERMDQGGRP